MNAIELLLASFDDVWNHRWESTTSVLEGVTPEEAGWRHPAYAREEEDEGLPLPGTILWHIAHLEYCTRYYTDILRLRPVTDDPEVVLPKDLSFPRIIELLADARAGLRHEMSLLTDRDLDAPCHHGKSVSEFLRMVIRHESWHGGQMAVVRRLYRERNAVDSASVVPVVHGGPSVVSLHHAQITVPPDAVDDARAFYCGLLGFPEVPKPESLQGRGGFWFRAGDRDVHVGLENGVDRTMTKAHLAYRVTDLEGWRTRLTERGFEIVDGIPIPGCDRFEFRDPFGNRIEMIE